MANDPDFFEEFHLALNSQQMAAVQACDGPVLLLAVPGSGKTTVLVARLGYLLYRRGVRPDSILTMTYTVSATQDMRSRFASVFGGQDADRLEFRTINGVCARIIRFYEQAFHRTAFQLIGDDSVLDALVGDLWRQTASAFAAESDIKAARTMITYVKNSLLSEEELAELKLEDRPFAPLYHAYCETLRERGWMDYDDQMVYAWRILRQYPDILRHFQDTYRYFCVDEAQDTSKIQHFLIRLLASGSRNLFMVGDEDQSIYGFRAAYPKALMEFQSVYPEAKVLLMEKNYRSTPQIVNLADRLIQKNQNRHPKHMTASRESGAAVRQISVYDRAEQYEWLAGEALRCGAETAVLYRDNDCALPVIDLFARRGIPYRCRQVDSSFFTHYIIRDITDIFHFAFHPDDVECFERIYYKFSAGISKAAALSAIECSRRDGGPVLDALETLDVLSPWTRTQIRALRTHLTNLREESAQKAVYRVIHFMGYGSYLQQRNADENKADILLALAAQEPSPERLLARLGELEQIVRNGSSSGPDGRMVLSTIHSSKGLEYPQVILLDVMDGILPKALPEENASPEDLDALEEERRLFYVGMTRARDELLLFRFRKADLDSTFVKELFPPQHTPRTSVKFQPAPKPSGGYRPPRDVTAEAEAYLPGACILHKFFGGGTILCRSGNIVTVSFDDGTVKRLDLMVALRQKLLSLA